MQAWASETDQASRAFSKRELQAKLRTWAYLYVCSFSNPLLLAAQINNEDIPFSVCRLAHPSRLSCARSSFNYRGNRRHVERLIIEARRTVLRASPCPFLRLLAREINSSRAEFNYDPSRRLSENRSELPSTAGVIPRPHREIPTSDT